MNKKITTIYEIKNKKSGTTRKVVRVIGYEYEDMRNIFLGYLIFRKWHKKYNYVENNNCDIKQYNCVKK